MFRGPKLEMKVVFWFRVSCACFFFQLLVAKKSVTVVAVSSRATSRAPREVLLISTVVYAVQVHSSTNMQGILKGSPLF